MQVEVEVGPEGEAGVAQGAEAEVEAGAGGEIQDHAPGAGPAQEEGQGLAQEEGGGAGAGLVLKGDAVTGTKVRFRYERKAEAEAETEGMIGKMRRGGKRRRKARHLQQLCPERSQRKTPACWGPRLEEPTSLQPS